MSQENIESTRRGFQAFNDRDLDGLLEVLDKDVELAPILAAMEAATAATTGLAAGGGDCSPASPTSTSRCSKCATSEILWQLRV